MVSENISKVKTQADQLIRYQDQLIQSQDQISNLNELNNKIITHLNVCEDELVDYALSTSWEVTRPLRKVSGKLKGLS